MSDCLHQLDSRLNRLIDGELSPDEYRALLAGMDAEPDGWRRCALVFLESQALGAELGSVRRTLDEKPTAQPSSMHVRSVHHPASQSESARARPTWQSNSLFLLAVAASFIATFSLGIFAPRYFSLTQQDAPVAGNFTGRMDETETRPVFAGQPYSGQAYSGQPYAGMSAENRHQTLRPVGNLRLITDGANGESIDAGEVPVYETGANLQDTLAGQQAVGPDLIELLKRHGFDVQHEQRYVPAPLEDGRQIIVPVDGYQIVPVGGRY